jgi:hypothetical protein
MTFGVTWKSRFEPACDAGRLASVRLASELLASELLASGGLHFGLS